MTSRNLAPCQAMVSIEDGEPLAKQIQHHIDRLPNEALNQATLRLKAHLDAVSTLLDHNQTVKTSGGEKPHVTITIDYATLIGDKQQLPEIDGAAVNPETIKRIICDASIVRILTDSESMPIDVGRRVRTIPPALRRALELRDGGCTWPGCTAPVSWCDAHHEVHWADGGETNLENTQLPCRRHHTATHTRDRSPPWP